jgi:hypothetical protein
MLLGILIGTTLSSLTKLFAFRSRSWLRSKYEASCFLIAYGIALFFYSIIVLASSYLLQDLNVAAGVADMSGVVLGYAVMVVTSYLGHRFFTYQTNVIGNQG